MNQPSRLTTCSLLVLLLLALSACAGGTPQVVTATPPPATNTAIAPTATAVPSATAEPSATATAEPSATATEEPETSLGTLEYGQSESGSIEEAGAENSWTLDAQEDDVVFVSVATVGDEMQPTISLLDSEGFEVAASTPADNGATLVYTVEDEGEYSLVIGALGRETGPYEVTVYNAQPGGGEIEVGESVNSVVIGQLTEDTWTFTANAGDAVDITVEAEDEDFDTVIEVFDAEGNSIARDDDSGEDYNPQLIGISLFTEGEYSIEVRALSDGVAGAYELTLSEGEAAGGGTIAFDERVEGELTSVPQRWTFEGQEGERIDIALNAITDTSGLDPRLTLFDAEGNELASDDDDGPGLNSLLSNFQLPATGSYTIQISAYSGEGPYELTLRRAVVETAGTVTYGETVTGTLTSRLPQIWTFEGQEGDVVTIAVDADPDATLDPIVSLVDPSNQEVALDDDGGEVGLNSLISDFTLPASGTYSLYVSAVSGEGAYQLTLQRAE